MAQWTTRELKKLKENPNDYPWDDIRVPMQNTRINAAKSEPSFEAWIDGIHAYHFDAANDADESLHFSIQIPHDWAEGTNLRPHLHWAPKTTNTGNVVWEIEYIAAKLDGTFPASATTLEVTTAADGTANKHQLVKFGDIDASELKISSMIHFRLTRLGDDGSDTFTGDAVACEFDAHYQRDSNGSYHELEKLNKEYKDQKGVPEKKFQPGAW